MRSVWGLCTVRFAWRELILVAVRVIRDAVIVVCAVLRVARAAQAVFAVRAGSGHFVGLIGKVLLLRRTLALGASNDESNVSGTQYRYRTKGGF